MWGTILATFSRGSWLAVLTGTAATHAATGVLLAIGLTLGATV